MTIIGPDTLLQRTDYLQILMGMAEQARRERIITLPRSEYEQIVPAHIAAAKLAEGTR